MSTINIRRSVVTFEDGTLGLAVSINGEEAITLRSDFTAKTKDDINWFAISVGVIQAFTTTKEDLMPLAPDTESEKP